MNTGFLNYSFEQDLFRSVCFYNLTVQPEVYVSFWRYYIKIQVSEDLETRSKCRLTWGDFVSQSLQENTIRKYSSTLCSIGGATSYDSPWHEEAGRFSETWPLVVVAIIVLPGRGLTPYSSQPLY